LLNGQTTLLSTSMAGHTSPPQEQEQEAERRLLDLHSRLWGLATELLLLPTEQGGDDDHPSQRSSPRPRPPLAIIEVSELWSG
jgi:hypothetical protein